MKEIKKRNKKAWIKIAEAFIAILMIVSALSIILISDLVRKDDGSDQIHEQEFYILQKIQFNSSLRSEILDISTLPIESTSPSFPFNFTLILNSTELRNLNCSLKVCIIGDSCVADNLPSNKEVYARSIIINSDLDTYDPRELSIFCWRY